MPNYYKFLLLFGEFSRILDSEDFQQNIFSLLTNNFPFCVIKLGHLIASAFFSYGNNHSDLASKSESKVTQSFVGLIIVISKNYHFFSYKSDFTLLFVVICFFEVLEKVTIAKIKVVNNGGCLHWNSFLGITVLKSKE